MTAYTHYRITTGYYDEASTIGTLLGPAGQDVEQLWSEFNSTYRIVGSLEHACRLLREQGATVQVGGYTFETRNMEIPQRVVMDFYCKQREAAQARLHADGIESHAKEWLFYFVAWLIAKKGFQHIEVDEVHLNY